MLTPSEWKKLKVGLTKDAAVDDGVVAIFGGPYDSVRYAFAHRNINEWDTPIENGWLVKRFKEFYEKKPSSTKDLLGWASFMEDNYDLDTFLPLIKRLGIVSISLMQSRVEKEQLAKRLVEITNRDFEQDRAKDKRAY